MTEFVSVSDDVSQNPDPYHCTKSESLFTQGTQDPVLN